MFYDGLMEILYTDGTSDAVCANDQLFRDVCAEVVQGECLINIPCYDEKTVEFLSTKVKKISLIIGPSLISWDCKKQEGKCA